MRTGPEHPLRLLCAALLLGAAFAPFRLGAQVDSSEGTAAQPGYTPLQYTPLTPQTTPANGNSYTNQNQTPDTGPAASSTQTPAANGTASDNAPPVNFQPLTAATRPATADLNFVPVVGTVRDVDGTRLVNSSQGLPRLYAPGLRAGPFDIDVNASLIGTYSDNIYLAPQGSSHTADLIFNIDPTISATYANGNSGDIDSTQFWSYYAPSGLVFTQHGSNSAINQQFNATLAHRFTRLAVNLSQGYSYTSGEPIAGGVISNQSIYNSSMDLDYAATDKTSFELATAYSINQYSAGFGSNNLTASGYTNYQIRPKVTLGVGPSFNYLTSENGTGSQTAIGANFRMSYNYSEKTTLYLELGGDQRQYSGSNLTNLELTYVAGVSWAAGPKTSVGLTASRATDSSSITANQDYIASDVGWSVSQTLLDRFAASLTLGYEHADYYSTSSGVNTFSSDFYSISPGLTFHPTIWSDVGMFYLYRQELSTGAAQFINNQISVFSSVRF